MNSKVIKEYFYEIKEIGTKGFLWTYYIFLNQDEFPEHVFVLTHIHVILLFNFLHGYFFN